MKKTSPYLVLLFTICLFACKKNGNQTADIPRNGLLAFYSFNGNTNDLSSNALHGVNHGVSFGADRFGNAGAAAVFNGIDNYITIPDTSLLQMNGSMTLAVWVKTNDHKPCSMLSRYIDPNIGMQGFDFDIDHILDKSKFGLSIKNTDPGIIFLVSEIIPRQWTFLAVTVEGTQINYYINDEEVLSSGQSKTLTNATGEDLVIGASSDQISHTFFEGVMDDIAIYNRALSKNEVIELYRQNITK